MPDGIRNAGHTSRNKEVGMPLPALAFCVNLGILPLLFLPTLPEIEHVWMIAVQDYCSPAGISATFVMQVLRFCFSPGDYWRHCRSSGLQHLPGANRQVRVVITGTDHATTHYADITHLDGKRIIPAAGITLYGEYLPQPVCVGQQWDMTKSAACTWATQ
jgi:competence protein ComEC